MNPKISRINNSSVSIESGIKPQNIVEGNPLNTLQNVHTDKTEQFFSGKWSSTRGKWYFEQEGEEYCHILSGKLRLTSTDNQVELFGQGDVFILSDGYKGYWEVLEPLEKYYVSWVPKKIESKL